MQIKERCFLPANGERVWELLQDVPLVINCIPGASVGERLAQTSYRAGIGVAYGDVGMRFDGDLRARFEPPDLVRVNAHGQAGQQVTVTADIDLRIVGEQEEVTELDVSATLTFTGGLARIASSAAEVVSPSLFRSFGACLASKLRAKGDAGP